MSDPDGANIPAQKAALRAEVLAALAQITAAERAASSETIRQRLRQLDCWQKARRILFFTPFANEPEITPLLEEALAAGQEAVMLANTLAPGAPLRIPFLPDLVLVPGLAFTRAGHRLGRGNGVYDRILAGELWDAATAGVCFALQLRETVPLEEHDVQLDAVVCD
jgi:5-formyltetrahydrofolate cyclo-ligase